MMKLISFFIILIFFNCCAGSRGKEKLPAKNKYDQFGKEHLIRNPNYLFLYNGGFNLTHFEKILEIVESKYYDSSRINYPMGYADAIADTVELLSIKVLFFPEEYYFKFKTDKTKIPEGEMIKVTSDSKYVFIKTNIKNKINNDIENADDRYIERYKGRMEIHDYLSSMNLNKSDLENTLAYIYKNKTKFKSQSSDESFLNEIVLNATNGFLSSLDPNSKVFNKNFKSADKVKIQGVGLLLRKENSKIIVEAVLGNPTEMEKEIESGDIISKVDGEYVDDMPVSMVMKMLQGANDSKVSIDIIKKESNESVNVILKRQQINFTNVTSRLYDNLAYIKFQSLMKTEDFDTVAKVKEEFHKLEILASKKNIVLKGLIIDIRNNTGGYLDLSISLADLFLSKGVIGTMNIANKTKEDFFAKVPAITKLPIGIMVNSRTSSGAELFAGSLQDHKRAILLGERTFGIGTIQKLFDIPGTPDYFLKITNGIFLLPSGRSTQIRGLEPNIKISAEKDGSFPEKFREANRYRHNPYFNELNENRLTLNQTEIENWVKSNGSADKNISKSQKDYFLYRAIDHFNAYLNTHIKN